MSQQTLSSLVGGALGDALGYSREFFSPEDILSYLPHGDWRKATFDNAPHAVRFRDRDGKALISDDTQMTIATGRALLATEEIGRTSFESEFAQNLSEAYVYWSRHPDNTRAPGGACMAACGKLAKGQSWQQATDINTMGCGANMRVAPIALYKNPYTPPPVDLTYLSAAQTHAHPAALAAAGLTTAAISGAYDGMTPQEILNMLLLMCQPGYATYPLMTLGSLWAQSEYDSARGYMQAGYNLCGFYLRKADAALRKGWKGQTDPCTITGDGWIAPQALAGAVLCAVGLWDKPVQVLQRAAVSNGDSDSLAAIAGNIRGAAGVEWPEYLVSQLEAAPLLELHKLAKAL